MTPDAEGVKCLMSAVLAATRLISDVALLHTISRASAITTMSDPIPSATADTEAVEHHLPANAEDRKAAAALNSLKTNELAADGSPKVPSSADQEALGKAMSRLEIAAGQGSAKKTQTETQEKEAEVKKKAIKIAPADVTLLVCTGSQGWNCERLSADTPMLG